MFIRPEAKENERDPIDLINGFYGTIICSTIVGKTKQFRSNSRKRPPQSSLDNELDKHGT